MALRRSSHRAVVRAPKRKVTWVGPADQSYVSVASGGSTLLQSFDPAAGGPFPKPTIVRVRGEVSMRLDSYAVDIAVVGAFGCCVVDNEAFTAGIASIPTPLTNSSWDGWFVWLPMHFSLEFGSAIGVQVPADRVWTIDSKAMRKVSNDQTIVWVAESEVGAFDISVQTRILMMLS